MVRHRQQGHWFVPGLVAAGLTAFFAWQLGWIPVRFAETETGSLLVGEPELLVDEIREFKPGVSLDDRQGAPPVEVASIPEQFEPQFEPGFGPGPFDSPPQETDAAGTSTTNPFEDEEFSAAVQRASVATPEPAAGVRHADFNVERSAGHRAVEPSVPNDRLPNSPDRLPPSHARDIVVRLAEVDRLLADGDYLTAHSELSKIYWHQPNNRELVYQRIENTARSIYAARQPHYVKPYVVQPGDQLRLIARHYNVPWQYLAYLNGVNERGIHPGQKLKVNRGPFSAVIDLSDFEMTIHAHGYYVHRYPVGIGREGTTPLGEFDVLQKLENPTYYGPDGEIIDGADPANPLGEYWIDIGDGYGVHGTINPESIGRAESRGCIRMKNEHIPEVYNLLDVGSKVILRR